jgi:hypothetical protein
MTTEEWKDGFETIADAYIKREGIKDLLQAIAKTDFYTAPASTKYHDSHENGLVKHSLEVFDILLTDLEDEEVITAESIAIVALFHDLCKTGFYEVSTRNTKDEKGKWIQVPYYTVNDLLPIGHSEKSIIMILQFMKLTDDEIMAINAHMGGWDKRDNVVSNTFGMCPLAVHLHIADLKATYLK